MTRRRRRGVVTLDTLIEAARKVKRPNLRQLRRNGEVPKGEMIELLAEASGVPVDEIQSVGQEALWLVDPARTYEELCSVYEHDGGKEGVNGAYFSAGQLRAMNPSWPTVRIALEANSYHWSFIVRNPSLWIALMEKPNVAWSIVKAATDSLIPPRMRYREQWEVVGTEASYRWAIGNGKTVDKEEKEKRLMAITYAVALNDKLMAEAWDGEIDPIGDSPELQSSSARLARLQGRGDETDRVKDWPAHARVINLILPYFEQIRDLKLLR